MHSKISFSLPCIRKFRFIIFILALYVLCFSSAVYAITDFTFIHASDVHAPHAKSGGTISEIINSGPVYLEPYKVTSDKPSFVLVTGDLTEFGYGNGAWETYLSYWKDVRAPVYAVSGNHDGTWDCMRDAMRSMYGSICYSFDKYNCHFIALDTATPQDPRPGITLEQIDWLKSDLRKTGQKTPVFIFLHHPLYANEFASMYERDRFVDILRPYNIVLILAGHSHNYQYHNLSGIDLVMGGSTALPEPGYNIVSIKDSILRVAYKKTGESSASTPVLEKPMQIQSTYPSIRIINPSNGDVIKDTAIHLQIDISNTDAPVKKAYYSIDDNTDAALNMSKDKYNVDVNMSDLTPGAHYMRVSFEDINGKTYQKTTTFYYDDSKTKVLWRVFGSGSFKGTPAVTDYAVYAGDTDGQLYAYRRSDGKQLWSYKTGGEIICQPAVTESGIYFGSGDCSIYALNLDGSFKWRYKTKRPVYSSPVTVGDMVIVGSNDPAVYALDGNTGQVIWINSDPGYTIESKPFIRRGTVYLGAWDSFLYALDLRTGKLRWKHKTQGVVKRNGSAEKYYSPGDSGPVVAGTKVFVADRNYVLGIHNTLDGSILESKEGVSATSLSEDGRYIYIRGTKGELTKIDTDGKTVWSVNNTGADSIPAAPKEKDGLVYISSKNGRLRVLSANDGSSQAEYQITPGLYIFAGIEARDGIAYTAGMDGSITAIDFLHTADR
ncbi:MAG: outer membrane protein assembly factor BamB family protein [Armatimonadota bacterium]